MISNSKRSIYGKNKNQTEKGDLTEESLTKALKGIPKGKLPEKEEELLKLFPNSSLVKKLLKRKSTFRAKKADSPPQTSQKDKSSENKLSQALQSLGNFIGDPKGKPKSDQTAAMIAFGKMMFLMGNAHEGSLKAAQELEQWTKVFEYFIKKTKKEKPEEPLLKDEKITNAIKVLHKALGESASAKKEKSPSQLATKRLQTMLGATHTLTCKPGTKDLDKVTELLSKVSKHVGILVRAQNIEKEKQEKEKQEKETTSKQKRLEFIFLKFVNNPKYKESIKVKGFGLSGQPIQVSSRISTLLKHGDKWEQIKKDPEIQKAFQIFSKWMKSEKFRNQIKT